MIRLKLHSTCTGYALQGLRLKHLTVAYLPVPLLPPTTNKQLSIHVSALFNLPCIILILSQLTRQWPSVNGIALQASTDLPMTPSTKAWSKCIMVPWLCKIEGSNSRAAEDWSLLGCDTVSSLGKCSHCFGGNMILQNIWNYSPHKHSIMSQKIWIFEFCHVTILHWFSMCANHMLCRNWYQTFHRHIFL